MLYMLQVTHGTNIMLLMTRLLHAYKINADYLNSPEVSINSEIFGTDDVSVSLDIQVDNLLLTINISSSPEFDIAVNTSRAHFTIPYNTPTNVSISANLCGMQNATIIKLNYGEYIL